MKKTIYPLLLSLLAIGGIALAAHAQAVDMDGPEWAFANKAASGGMMEVQLGKLAAQQAQSSQVQQFGMTMVEDHGAANEELGQIFRQKNRELPAELLPEHRATVDKLQGVSGAEFDHQYMRAMVKDHAKDVEEFRNAARRLQDPDLSAWVDRTLPVLERHLQQARTLAGQLGVDAEKAEEEGRRQAKKEAQEKGR